LHDSNCRFIALTSYAPGVAGISPNRLILGPFLVLSENLSMGAVKKTRLA